MGVQLSKPLAKRPVDCSLTCASPEVVLCTLLTEALSCNHNPTKIEQTLVQISVIFENSPFCYTPFYKTGTLAFHSFSTISGSHFPEGSTQISLRYEGKIEQTVTGIASCREFRSLLVKNVAEELAKTINREITKH